MLIPSTTPALAAGGNLNLTVEAVNPTVQSGAGESFRVQRNYAGSGSCDHGRIEVPVPAGLPGSAAFPDGVPLAITSQSGIAGGTAAVEGEAPNQVLVWTLPETGPRPTSSSRSRRSPRPSLSTSPPTSTSTRTRCRSSGTRGSSIRSASPGWSSRPSSAAARSVSG